MHIKENTESEAFTLCSQAKYVRFFSDVNKNGKNCFTLG